MMRCTGRRSLPDLTSPTQTAYLQRSSTESYGQACWAASPIRLEQAVRMRTTGTTDPIDNHVRRAASGLCRYQAEPHVPGTGTGPAERAWVTSIGSRI